MTENNYTELISTLLSVFQMEGIEPFYWAADFISIQSHHFVYLSKEQRTTKLIFRRRLRCSQQHHTPKKLVIVGQCIRLESFGMAMWLYILEN